MNDVFHLLENVFESVLTTSWQASWGVGLILLVSWLSRQRLTSGLRYVFWVMLFLHMVLPFLWIPNPFSLFNWVPENPMQMVEKKVQKPVLNEVQRLGDQESSSEHYVEASETLAPVLDSDSPSTSYTRVQAQPPKNEPFWWMILLASVWLVGCLFLLLQMAYQNWKFSHRVHLVGPLNSSSMQALLRQLAGTIGLQQTPNLVESRAVSTPAVHNFRKPAIILPAGMSQSLTEDQLRHVFLHELAHIKRRDLLVQWFAHVVRAVHWFNPFIWIAVARLRVECELETDILALRHVGEAHRHAYGETILDLVKRVNASNRIPGLVGIVEGKKEMTRRILSIRNFPNYSQPSRTAIFSFAIVWLVSLSGAVKKPQISPQPMANYAKAPKNKVLGLQGTGGIVCAIVDTDGNPVPAVQVSFGERDNFLFLPIGQADEGGRIRIPFERLKPDMVLDAAGFAPTMLAFDYDPSRTNRTYQLQKAATVAGRITDENDVPIPDAEVKPMTWHAYPLLSMPGRIERSIKTDKDGQFVWNHAPHHGEIVWSIQAEGYRSILSEPIPVGNELNLKMSRPDRVIGTVVDAETGEPIRSFHFLIGQQLRESGPILTIDRQGRGIKGLFKMDVIKPARRFHVIQVSADGYAPAQSPVFQDGDGELEFRFELNKDKIIPLSVVQPDGQPASSAIWVQALSEEYESFFPKPKGFDVSRLRATSRMGITDHSGHVDIRPVVDFAGILLTHEQGYAEVSLTALQAPNEIHLRPWGRVEGKLFSGSKPLAGETIGFWRNNYELSTVSVQTKTGPDGSFAFHELPAGDYKLRTEIGTTLDWARVEAGKTTHLVVGQDGRTIRGKAKADILLNDGLDWNWQVEHCYLATDSQIPVGIEEPTEQDRKGGDAGIQRFRDRRKAFWDSPEGKAIERSKRSYAVKFEHDGSFLVEGVVPGRYILELQLKERWREGPNLTHVNTIAESRTPVVVSAQKDSLQHEDIDLGVIELLADDDN